MRPSRPADRIELSNRKMIDAAIKIILRRGIAGLRLTDVGLRAGYSRGLATMRFGNMEGLLRCVAEKLHEFWLDQLSRNVRNKTGLAAISAAIDSLDDSLQSPTQEIRVQFLIFFYSMDPSAEFHINTGRLLMGQRRDIEKWIREAIDAREASPDICPEAEAGQILSSMIGIIYQSLMNPKLKNHLMFKKLKSDIRARISCIPRTISSVA